MDTERKAAYDDLLAFMAEAPDVPALGDASRESDRAILAERYEDNDEVDDYVPAELAVGFLEYISRGYITPRDILHSRALRASYREEGTR